MKTENFPEKTKGMATSSNIIIAKKIKHCIAAGKAGVAEKMAAQMEPDDLLGYAKLAQIFTKADAIFFMEDDHAKEDSSADYFDNLSEASAFCNQAIKQHEQQLINVKDELAKKALQDQVDLKRKLVQ